MKYWQHLSSTRPWLILAIAAVIMLAVGWYASGLFSELSTGGASMQASGTAATNADETIKRTFGQKKGSDIVLFERKDLSLGTATDAAYQTEMSRLLKPLENHAESIVTYRTYPDEALLSKDKTASYAIVTMKTENQQEAYRLLDEYQRSVDSGKLAVSVSGAHVAEEQIQAQVQKDLVRAEIITLPILLILLLVFFRSGVAALVPLGISLLTMVGAFAIARFANLFVPIDTYAINVITILGLGLSIDYALLVVNRFREELVKRSVPEAVQIVIATACRTVFFSGVTVMACLLSLLFFPVEALRSIAIGGSAAVMMAVVITVVIVPPLLRVIGLRIDYWRVPGISATAKKKSSGRSVWWRIAHLSARRPTVTLACALIVVVATLLPLRELKIGTVDYTWFAQGQSAYHVGRVLDEQFEQSQTNGAQVLVTFPEQMPLDERVAYACDFASTLGEVEGIVSVTSPTTVPGLGCAQLRAGIAANALPDQVKTAMATRMTDSALLFDVVLRDAAGSRAARDTIDRLRAMPVENGILSVGGVAAVVHDTIQQYIQALPYVLLVVGVSMMIVLSLLLRSIVLPVQAIVINTVALGIAMGMIVGFFQLGWFRDITSLAHVNSVDLSAPILVMAIAFGLAMDYSVFLYSRMREVYDKTRDPQEAVEQGVVKTGPIVTAAALVFFVVVVAFIGSNIAFMQIIGLGLAVAVLVDAFFVRLVLVPAVMRLMKHSSWYAPKWLNKWQIRHD